MCVDQGVLGSAALSVEHPDYQAAVVYHPLISGLVGGVGESGADRPHQVRCRQDSIKAFCPTAAPVQAEAWMGQSADEFQPIILLPEV